MALRNAASLRGHRFSLVILDLVLAGGDPARLITELRSTAEHASMPILLLGNEDSAPEAR